MPETEQPTKLPLAPPIDEAPPPRPRSPPSLSKLPPVDPKSIVSQSADSPSTPRPKSPKPEKKDGDEPKKAPIPPPEEEPPSAGEDDADTIINMETFQQILDLDDDEGYDFSREMAWEYFSQVHNTFKEMDKALARKDLTELSSLGHFLKGSSAALGVVKVQLSCEKIQHFGQLRDEDNGKDISETEALSVITKLLAQVKKEQTVAEQWLRDWYAAHPDPE